jgi:hypothetical protein
MSGMAVAPRPRVMFRKLPLNALAARIEPRGPSAAPLALIEMSVRVRKNAKHFQG